MKKIIGLIRGKWSFGFRTHHNIIKRERQHLEFYLCLWRDYPYVYVCMYTARPFFSETIQSFMIETSAVFLRARPEPEKLRAKFSEYTQTHTHTYLSLGPKRIGSLVLRRGYRVSHNPRCCSRQLWSIKRAEEGKKGTLGWIAFKASRQLNRQALAE